MPALVRPPNPLTAAWLLSHPMFARGHPLTAARVPDYNPGARPATPAGMPSGIGPAPTAPPIGSYDPSLDIGQRSAQRGLADFMADSALQGARSTDDYQLSRQRLRQQHTQTVDDLMRQYQLLGKRQTQQMQVLGTEEGGAPKEAAQIRRKNEQRQESRIDQSFKQNMGQLQLTFGRQAADRALATTRAQREAGFYGQDVGQARWFQAAQSGMIPGLGSDPSQWPPWLRSIMQGHA